MLAILGWLIFIVVMSYLVGEAIRHPGQI